MLINLIYCIFLASIDYVIYIHFTEKGKLNKSHYYLLGIVVLVFTITHLDFFNLPFLLSSRDFFHIFMFSIGLIIIHYQGTILSFFLKNKKGNIDEKVFETYHVFFDFMRQKLIYIMIYIYQFLAIWNESFR